MNARLASSAIWTLLLLVPPLRVLVEQLAQLLWPSVQPFTFLAGLHTRWVPFVVLVALGYLATWAAGKKGLRELARSGVSLRQPRGAPGFRLPGMAVTGVWVILAAALGQLTVPFALIGALVVLGLSGRLTAAPEPPPEPLPRPTPPTPLPDQEAQDWTEDGEDDTRYYRTYSWLFDEEPYRKAGRTHRFSARLSIPKSLYEDLVGRDHTVHSHADYVGFADAQLDDETVSHLATQIRSIAEENDFDDLTEIHLAMAFTLAMPYALDEEEHDGEYPKFPVEMLVDKRGDCEDFSILCGALLYRLGHPAALVLMSFAHLDHGHAALGVVPPEPIPGEPIYSPELGADYFYCEVTPAGTATTETTTNVQWWLGRSIPEGAENFKVYPIGA